METHNEEPVFVYYPLWMKVISWLGLPALTLVAFWLISRPAWEEGLGVTQSLVGMVIGCAVLYQCIIGFVGLQYLNMTIHVLDEGLQIHFKNTIRLVPWSQIARIKEFSFATTTRLSERNGDTIIYASDSMKNFHIIKHVLSNKLG